MGNHGTQSNEAKERNTVNEFRVSGYELKQGNNTQHATIKLATVFLPC